MTIVQEKEDLENYLQKYFSLWTSGNHLGIIYLILDFFDILEKYKAQEV